eukprot:TRINITY_DN4403_c0_g1_i1.p1 TRINITY_DN4403_c0_g1~~TRINITY_DN4403_c0_g1_i1.p1  ORF type:complete len:325 (+),score=43.63 TRINITY_DN4403_c0_g1_i1:39-977(+)
MAQHSSDVDDLTSRLTGLALTAENLSTLGGQPASRVAEFVADQTGVPVQQVSVPPAAAPAPKPPASVATSSSKTCAICYEEISEMALTMCGHAFCTTCLVEWESVGTGTCPMCRQQLLSWDVKRNPPREPARGGRKLLIFAMRGTLIDRVRGGLAPGARRHGTYNIFSRPGLPEFMKFVFANFDVAIWSSAEPQNTHPLVEDACCGRRPLFVWTRDDTTPDNERRQNARCKDDHYATVKDLSKVWRAFPDHTAATTALIDDTTSKARLQPRNHIFMPGWEGGRQDSALRRLQEFCAMLLRLTDIRDLLPHHV